MKKKGHTDSNDWVSLRQSGKRLSPPVEWQAVQQWIGEGFAGTKKDGRRVLVNVPALAAWRAKYRRDPDEPGHGGRREPERKRRDPGQQEIEFEPAERRPLPITERQILDRAAAGDLTAAVLSQSNDALKVLKQIRESAKEAGRLLDSEDVEREHLAAHLAVRTRLDQIPARSEKRAVSELGLSGAVAAKLRAMIADEVDAACRELQNHQTPSTKTSPPKK